jgi:hypothetical protein
MLQDSEPLTGTQVHAVMQPSTSKTFSLLVKSPQPNSNPIIWNLTHLTTLVLHNHLEDYIQDEGDRAFVPSTRTVNERTSERRTRSEEREVCKPTLHLCTFPGACCTSTSSAQCARHPGGINVRMIHGPPCLRCIAVKSEQEVANRIACRSGLYRSMKTSPLSRAGEW